MEGLVGGYWESKGMERGRVEVVMGFWGLL